MAMFNGKTHELSMAMFNSNLLVIEGKIPIKSHWTTIFLWFSYGFPMVFLWVPHSGSCLKTNQFDSCETTTSEVSSQDLNQCSLPSFQRGWSKMSKDVLNEKKPRTWGWYFRKQNILNAEIFRWMSPVLWKHEPQMLEIVMEVLVNF